MAARAWFRGTGAMTHPVLGGRFQVDFPASSSDNPHVVRDRSRDFREE